MMRRVCIAVVPLAALIAMIVLGVAVFGRDAGSGPNQISLVFATALAIVSPSHFYIPCRVGAV